MRQIGRARPAAGRTASGRTRRRPLGPDGAPPACRFRVPRSCRLRRARRDSPAFLRPFRKPLMKRLLLALVAAALPWFAMAQTYPAKPIHIVVPFPPGGPTDVLGRLVGQALGDTFSQTVIVENKAGAAGNIGVAQVAKAAPDGYTLGIIPAG